VGKEIAGKQPVTLITDGAPNFHELAKGNTSRKAANKMAHIKDIRMSGQVHNDRMERMNGEIRDREKVMRGLKRSDTPVIPGYQIYHNHVRPHEALTGKTPAEAAGIKVKVMNRWLTIIQNASRIR
jgi:hypothetical protein